LVAQIVENRGFTVASSVFEYGTVTAFEAEQHAFHGLALGWREGDFRRHVALGRRNEFEYWHRFLER
jgi:hypothetical protein